MAEKNQQIRKFIFTINNYTLDDIDEVVKIPYKYIIVGAEVGEEGTPHLQGYCELIKKTRWNTIRAFIKRSRIHEAFGTYEENRKYCTKEGDFYEDGEHDTPGSRKDLGDIRDAAYEGGMRAVLRRPRLNFQQIKIAEKYLTYYEEARVNANMNVMWFWGPTGAGKSRTAYELLVDDDFYTKGPGKWWDEYDGHDAVLIDDFRSEDMPLGYLLKLLDRNQVKIETKGGMRQFVATKIIITCPFHPKDCYRNSGEDMQQLVRRCNLIQRFEQEVGGNNKPQPYFPELEPDNVAEFEI